MPCPDSALRAVRMAAAMRDRVYELAGRWRTQGHELGFGIGIAQGLATIGRIGFEGRYDYGAIGTVVNLAARLCAAAKPGQILISQRVYDAVADRVDGEPFGELQVKGLRQPVTAFNVRGLHGGPGPTHAP
jgi:adenylate cyclase